MGYQLADSGFRSALDELLRLQPTAFVFAGTVAAQLHLALALGADKVGPPAGAIEVILLAHAVLPESVRGIPVRRIDTLGFDASIAAARSNVELDGVAYPVASPEHVLGTMLARPGLSTEGRWAAFALMRALETRGLDYEEVRGILKRCGQVGREELLHELAYLAA